MTTITRTARSFDLFAQRYGHLARDRREHAVSLLDALAIERVVDAGWTPRAAAGPTARAA